MIDFQLEFIRELGVQPKPFEPSALYGDDVWSALSAYKDRLEAAIVPDRQEREAGFDALKEEAKAAVSAAIGEDEFAGRAGEFGPAWKSLQKKVMRGRVIEKGLRLDGRSSTDIRPLSAEVGVLPRAHGSALFERGDTHVLNITTLGMLRMN